MSIIITSYNEIEYLSEAIESCLSQTFQDFEIIIGDDGSNDGSLELIKNYCEKYPGRINYFVMDRPSDDKEIIVTMRVSNVVKEGLKKARGKYAVILNGDDYFCDNEKFFDAVNFLNSHDKHVSYVSGFKMLYPDNEAIISYQHWHYPNFLFWAGRYLHVSCFIFRKSVFDNGHFPNRFCDDTGLCFALACTGKWIIVDKVTAVYRQRKSSDVHITDNTTLAVRELVLFQDCLCKGKLIWSSYSRFHNPLKYVYEHREELAKPEYEKYFKSCALYEHNILAEVAKCDSSLRSKLFIKLLLLKGKIARFLFFHYIIRIYHIPGKLRRIFKKITRS